ncbi:hypothetical protein, partial [Catenibacterium sp.]|uniref:hypothetical protein n=1 Tax=Catenibacterium sp. TaxID=2049022 RepID=UPI0026E00FD2
LEIRFDEDGRYGNKGNYVVRMADYDKLTEYLSKTKNYYDEVLIKVVKNEEEKRKKGMIDSIKKEEKEQ